MTPPPTPLTTLAWTPAEAALILSPPAGADLLGPLAQRLLPEIGPGRFPADGLIALHQALKPWLRGREPGRNLKSET